MKYVHLGCLKSWLDSNKKVKQNQYHTITLFNAISCELCKETFPARVKHRDQIIDILKYKKPESINYIVLDTLETEALFEEKIKVYHTFEFRQQNEIAVGRQFGVHARITDVTISRTHCSFKLYKRSQIWLKDFKSKFGTLALLTKPLTVDANR